MTPKEKAKELVDKFENAAYNYFTNTGDGIEVAMLAKQSALIAIDEIEKAIDFDWMEVQNLERQYAYWEEVKQEIEKL